MPYINVNLKVKGGKRTPVEVWTILTAVNERTIEFANGNNVTGSDIADVVVDHLQVYLHELQNRPPGLPPMLKLFIITVVPRFREGMPYTYIYRLYKLLAKGVPSTSELIALGADISLENDLVSVNEVSSVIWDIVDGHILGGKE